MLIAPHELAQPVLSRRAHASRHVHPAALGHRHRRRAGDHLESGSLLAARPFGRNLKMGIRALAEVNIMMSHNHPEFRKGYAEGAYEAFAAYFDRFSPDEVKAFEWWVKQALQPWADSNLTQEVMPPPAFPKVSVQPVSSR